MHDIGKGRWAFVGDFVASMNKGPVKLDFGKDAKPVSEKQKRMDELNERNLKLIQRSLVLGSALAAVACIVGWQVTKWIYGVKNVNEFGDVMRERMPKVSGKLEDSALGRRLKESSEVSRDKISENSELTDWRRSLRGKFNTEEGARVARMNSVALAERRQMEKIARKSRSSGVSSVSPFGVTFPTRTSPGPTSAPMRIIPRSSRSARMSSERFGMSREISSGPSLVSRASISWT